jgi:hypothetical protein
MMRRAGILVLALAAIVPANAAGPVDGELGLLWWQTDFARDTDIEDVSIDAGAPGVRGELWLFNKFGLRASLFTSDLEDLDEDDADYRSADLMYRLFSVTQKNFISLGVGWQDMEFTESGLGAQLVETEGARVMADGRFSLIRIVHVYANYTWLPELDDYRPDQSGDVYTDLEGTEYEVGLSWTIAPFLDTRFAYRVSELDFTREPALLPEYRGTIENEGFMIGMGFHF